MSDEPQVTHYCPNCERLTREISEARAQRAAAVMAPLEERDAQIAALRESNRALNERAQAAEAVLRMMADSEWDSHNAARVAQEFREMARAALAPKGDA